MFFKVRASLKPEKNNEYFTWSPKYIFWSYPAHFCVEWETFRSKLYRKSKNIIFLMTPPPPETQGVYEIMGKIKHSRHATDGNRIWLMHIACCIQNSTHTHLEYVIIIALPQQQWLHERASVLHYTYIACLVLYYVHSAPPTCFCHTVVAETCSRYTMYVI